MTFAESPKKRVLPCGTLFSTEGGGPYDIDGCRLPDGHAGPHEFVTPTGVVYRWETDWDCTCEECMREDGDYCSVYWQVEPPPGRQK